jgi:hypothetical protein
MAIKKKLNLISLQFILLLVISSYNPIKCDDYYKCSDGFKALDEVYCPTSISCPNDLIRINLYSCAYSQIFATPSKCKTGTECWNGECVGNEDEVFTLCPSHISCPKENITVKCPDNTCVKNVDDCRDYVECPSFNPIRCPNGDCRKSLEDCPSLIHCPDSNPILCNDGSCRKTKSQCKLPSEETACPDKKMTRCSDGTCSYSKFLCPTLVSCPSGYDKCWNGICKPKGTCKINLANENPLCDLEKEILCPFDYSCATKIDNCPTGIICPVDKPVKCWDNSCRDSVENCPEFQNCPLGLTECPDGSCGLGTCGTHITCSAAAPYRCFDNTCRRNPEDCPAQPSCPAETPILCWDGRCLAERGECLSPSVCDRVYPVKCPNGLCSKNINSCKEETECPTEFVRCKDGTCRKKLAYCPAESCPVNLPFKCKNGLCVSDEKYCDKDNGCPFNLPEKCANGKCVKEKSECPKEKPTCPDDYKLCPDGSCLHNKVVCPSQNGCPTDTPFRCANGECINLKKTSCSIPICDPTIPIKCFDGTCALTVNYCPTERKTAASGNVICADGTEAHSYEECKPLVKCGENDKRCPDGSCRASLNDCPKAETCPKGEVRCENGSCAENKNKCPTSTGCTEEFPEKCAKSGLCVKNKTECEKAEKEFGEANGCPKEKPIKCPKSGNCAAKLEDCASGESACGAEKTMCPDGFCATKLSECKQHSGDCSAEGRTTQCTNEPDICAKSLAECRNSLNCQVGTPFRCGNGECKKYPSIMSGSDGCSVGISCPSYRPFLCADGSCAEREEFCKSFSNCEEGKEFCPDKTCVDKEIGCDNHKKCPSKSPVLCPNGNCGGGIYDCNEGKCPKWAPYYCVLGDCSKSPRECEKIDIKELDDGVIERNIATVCKDNEYICLDGTCRENSKDCPIYQGCTSSDKSFKCYDGGCAANKDGCEYKNNITYFDCPEGLSLCEDGLCRKNCSLVEFNGCPNETPLLCSNGRCVSQTIECVGESACDSTEKPFRCIDGTCGASLAECKIPFREVGDTNILVSVYPKMEMVAELIIGPSNILAGKVEIPAGTITKKSDNSSAEAQLSFRSVTRSTVVDTYNEYDKTREDDLKSVYPYADPGNNYTLNYQYTVLSSVIEVNLKGDSAQISGKVLLTLLFDFPFKHEKLVKTNLYEEEDEKSYQKTSRYTTFPLNYNKDVCLAKLNVKTRKWECNKLNYDVEAKSNLQLTGELNENGIYAVVLHLKMNDNKLYINENWFISHLKLLTFIFLGILLLIGLVIYIFSRIYRYRVKYKGTKEIYKGFELEINDLQDKSVTGRQGQTYGDVKEGIIYTDNIAFKSQIDSEARKRNTQLEKIFDAYTKKLRLLERNNALLKGQYDSIKNEYNRLNNYKDTLKEGDQVKIQVDIKDVNENQDVGAINDEDDD